MEVGPSQITEEDFRARVKEVQEAYAPVVANFGGKLNVTGDWKEKKPNAFASQMGGRWQVTISGGLAQRPELTGDGLTLILCHEMGHHLAGFSFGPARNPMEKVWAANEGQSDYFASHSCAKWLWSDQVQVNAGFRATATPKIIRQCNLVWQSEVDQNLCYRTLTGVESVTATMASLMSKPVPDYETPDTVAVDKTNHNHPMPQCRMDTQLQGALCQAYFDAKIIPGKLTKPGPSSEEAERESASFTCTQYSGYQVGLRPTCWFKPRL